MASVSHGRLILGLGTLGLNQLKTNFAFFNESLKQQSVPKLLADLPIVESSEALASFDGYFTYANDTLNFHAMLDGKDVSMNVELVSGQVAYRRQQGGGRKQRIAKACGLKSNWNPKILDATGGLGRDAAELRNLGCELRLIERSPYVASLLQDAIQRAASNEQTQALFGQGFELYHGQSSELMKQLSEEEQPDIIYLDPMFPPRNKSAAVKKEMRLVKLLVGEDPDADEMLPIALECTGKRVVVKRPNYAPFLNEQKPNMSIESKGNRFDVYMV